MGQQEVKNIPYPVHAFSVSVGDRPASTSSTSKGEKIYQPTNRPQTLKLVSVLVGALAAGAIVAFAATKFLGPETHDKKLTKADTETQSNSASTADVTATKSSGETSRVAVPEEARTKPVDVGGDSQSGNSKLQQKAPAGRQVATAEPDVDVAATMRLRQARWSECNGSDLDRARDACTTLTREQGISPIDVSTAYRSLALAYRKSGKLDDAVESYTKSIEVAANAAAYDGRGISFLLKSDPDKALKDFNRAIELDDKAGEAYNNRAWTYFKLGKTTEALDDANKAVAIIPDKADVWDTRGHINEVMGKKKEALEDFERALAIDGTLQSAIQGSKRLKAD